MINSANKWKTILEPISFFVTVLVPVATLFYWILPKSKLDTDSYLFKHYLMGASFDLLMLALFMIAVIYTIKLTPWRKIFRFVAPIGVSKLMLLFCVSFYCISGALFANFLLGSKDFRRIGANLWRDAFYAFELRSKFYTEQIEKDIQKQMLRSIDDDIWSGNFSSAASKFQQLSEFVPDQNKRMWESKDMELPSRVLWYSDFMSKSSAEIKDRKGINREAFYRISEAIRLRQNEKNINDLLMSFLSQMRKGPSMTEKFAYSCRNGNIEESSKLIKDWKWFIFEDEIIDAIEKQNKGKAVNEVTRSYCDILNDDDPDNIVRRVTSSWQLYDVISFLKESPNERSSRIAQTYKNNRNSIDEYFLQCYVKEEKFSWTGMLSGYSAVRFIIKPDRVCNDYSNWPTPDDESNKDEGIFEEQTETDDAVNQIESNGNSNEQVPDWLRKYNPR